MLIFGRLVWYVVGFLVALTIVLYQDFWRPLDFTVYTSLYLDASRVVKMDKRIVVFDMPGFDQENWTEADVKDLRLRTADLLNQIAEGTARPDAVVLDFFYDNRDAGMNKLYEAIQRVEQMGSNGYPEPVPVFRVLNLDSQAEKSLKQVTAEHHSDLYGPSQARWYAHTIFKEAYGILRFPARRYFPGGDYLDDVKAMPIQVAESFNSNFRPDRANYVLALGPTEDFEAITTSFLHEEGKTEGGCLVSGRDDAPDWREPKCNELDVGDKLVVIGSVVEDRPKHTDRSGPELVAWSVSDQLRLGGSVARKPLDGEILAAVVLFFGFLTALLYAALFQVRQLQTRPVSLAVLSVIVAVGVLVLGSWAALGLDYVIPVGLPLCSIALAATFSGFFAYRFLVTGVVEGSEKYDIFISYSRAHKDWVVENVYEPLQALQREDGRKLSIFFDQDSIGLGEPFTARYMWAIVDSSHFLPVFSEDYYGKKHCRNEMDLAYKRSLDERLRILPVVHGAKPPAIYSHLNYIDAATNEQFMDSVAQTMTEV